MSKCIHAGSVTYQDDVLLIRECRGSGRDIGTLRVMGAGEEPCEWEFPLA